LTPALAERVRVAELPPDTVLTRQEVATWLALPYPRQVERLGVPCLDLGRRTKRYRKGDVLAWLETHRNGNGRRVA
jgi:hypothetical protein